MSDWNYINRHRIQNGAYASSSSDGFNGAFMISVPGEARRVCIIASDGEGWRHVSVSFGRAIPKPPSWAVMCAVKDLFWEPEDTVIQFHPAKSEYVNNHVGCLHLWQCTDGREQPIPESILVGIKELGTISGAGAMDGNSKIV